ncbi:hypothetical protein JCM3770_006002 [Rhodotorula araucariae]
MDTGFREPAIPTTLDFPAPPRSVQHSQRPSHSPAAPSPASSTAQKRKASEQDSTLIKLNKGKAKAHDPDRGADDDDSDDDVLGGDGKPKKKRNRVALSCAECKRRKIKCDRVMPVCGNCTRRGRPSECAWDVFQPANDAFLPPTIARTAELDSLAQRLAHVERYLQTLPPNFALFRPITPSATPVAGGLAVQAGRKGSAAGTGRPEREGEEGYSDTEDAAMSLENGVFSARIGLESANSSAKPSITPARPHLPHATSSVGPASGRNAAVRFGAPQLELTKALTCIVSTTPTPSASLKAHLLVDFDATLEEVQEARKAEVERIVRTLPGREATAFLVERYFTSVNWLFHHLHAPSFRAELDAFHSLCNASRANDVDLTWLALLLMVLCLALDSMHFSRSPLALAPAAKGGCDGTPLEQYTEEQLRALPERWFAASVRALKLAEWEAVPRIRSIQTIVLYTQYLQLSSPTRGQPSQLVWLAGAIRLAQVFNLHLLGSNPETMPPEDPAFPPGKNSLKREMAKRLWAVLVYQDWLAANSRNRCYLISPAHCDTDDPLNVNDTDLSPSTVALTPAPSSVLTDSSADRVRIAMARQVRAVFDRVILARDWGYDTVLELDGGFRTILDELPERWTLAADEQEDPMLRFQRHFVLEGLHNRIFRLHRPLLSKAHKNPKYKFSAEACLKSARAVVVSTHNIREAVADVPYTYSHVFGAALVLFNDLFQAIDHDGSATEIDSKVETLQLALEIFTSKPSSAALAHTVQQAHRILLGLFREEERRRQARAAKALMRASAGDAAVAEAEDNAEEQETFADVLHRIARSLDSDSAPHRGTPPPTRNLPSAKAKKATAPVPAAFLPPGAAATLLAGATDIAALAPSLAGGYAVADPAAAGRNTLSAFLAPSPGLAPAPPPPSHPLPSLASSAPPLAPDAWAYGAPAAADAFSSAFDAADGLDFGFGAFGLDDGGGFGLALSLEMDTGGGDGGGGGGTGAGMDTGTPAAGTEPFVIPEPPWELGAVPMAQVGMTDAEAAAAYWGTGGAGARGAGW